MVIEASQASTPVRKDGKRNGISLFDAVDERWSRPYEEGEHVSIPLNRSPTSSDVSEPFDLLEIHVLGFLVNYS